MLILRQIGVFKYFCSFQFMQKYSCILKSCFGLLGTRRIHFCYVVQLLKENMILEYKSLKMPPMTSTEVTSDKYFKHHFHQVFNPFSENGMQQALLLKGFSVSFINLYHVSLSTRKFISVKGEKVSGGLITELQRPQCQSSHFYQLFGSNIFFLGNFDLQT